MTGGRTVSKQVHRFKLFACSRYQAGGIGKREKRSSEEGHMCPACIGTTAVMVAGVGSTGGILAVCIGKFRKVLRASVLGLFQKTKEK
jgi:hypothetical protein